MDEMERKHPIMDMRRKLFIRLSIIGILIVGFVVFAILNGKTDEPRNIATTDTSGRATLNLSVSGPGKSLNITSDVDGFLGNYTLGTVDLKLSKRIQTLTIAGDTVDRSTLFVDMTEGDKSITTETKDKGSSAQIISNDSGSPQDVSIDSCSYYGNNTWLTCVVANPDFLETVVYQLENGAWKYVISGSYLTYEDFVDIGAPQDLLSKIERNN